MWWRAIVPLECAACGDETRATLLCPRCAESLYPNPLPCPRCARPFARAACPCRRRGWPVEATRAPYLYGGELGLALRTLKYQGREDLARRMGSFIAAELRAAAAELGADLIVPVPSHPFTRLARGMEHTSAIVSGTGVKVPVARALRRVGRAPRQATLSRAQRLANLRGAFAPTRWWRRRLSGRRVLLVDDVVTTGATAEAAARALTGCGCARIALFAVARAE